MAAEQYTKGALRVSRPCRWSLWICDKKHARGGGFEGRRRKKSMRMRGNSLTTPLKVDMNLDMNLDSAVSQAGSILSVVP